MATSPSPAEVLVDLSSMHMVARSLQVVAEMGVADILGDAPMSANALADRLKLHPDALARVLRLLATYGVFAETDGAFHHTPSSRLMRSDDPNSMRPWIRMMGAPINWSAYGAFDHALRTGTSARELFTDGDFFADYLPRHPETAKLFNESMASAARQRVKAVIDAYDFSPFDTIADIGGGRGHLIRGVLDARPGAKGILFDLPHAVEPTRALGVPRLTIIVGDFFKSELPRADAYMLMAVIHDWSDEESIQILRAVRKAAPPHAKLLLIERVIEDAPGAAMARRMDIHMLTALSGRERTRQEFATLFKSAGFNLDRIVPATGGASILEGTIAR